MSEHPLRTAEIQVFREVTIGVPTYFAILGSLKRFPIFFEGTTEADARNKARAFRADELAKNEAAFHARREAAAKARAARAKKDEGAPWAPSVL